LESEYGLVFPNNNLRRVLPIEETRCGGSTRANLGFTVSPYITKKKPAGVALLLESNLSRPDLADPTAVSLTWLKSQITTTSSF
jgi:hypothetical protein